MLTVDPYIDRLTSIMSLAEDKFLPTGTYIILNAEYNHSIAFDEQDQCLSTSNVDDYGVCHCISDFFENAC